jgi:DNA-binding HxlR family transcriptional regulator
MAKHDASKIKSEKTSFRTTDQVTDSAVQNDKMWDSIARNYEWISYAQISNSFILLMALNENKARNKALTAGEISEIIAQKSKGRLYKVPSTLRDALEYRLKREGLVEDENIANKSSVHKIPKVSRYSITPKGQKLLRGWIGFLSAFQ